LKFEPYTSSLADHWCPVYTAAMKAIEQEVAVRTLAYSITQGWKTIQGERQGLEQRALASPVVTADDCQMAWCVIPWRYGS
jgi:hypothetical protein